ncbi:hypothetical protein KK141_17285 [Dyella sp. LX-66]|uniref:ImmA/IrrE family metallo-endopeptidase n=1 Tax=unclassified Dyella TaxID=2634549 RepID=UPI001BDF8D39|nr:MULTISPECIES: hypothetical protein [unclassified Dyella]MBT2117788.1 hypothetical protein [Dyella sp. LX-1]MBT2141303.1 hypothetical protein [Dyella sp. LX-66]
MTTEDSAHFKARLIRHTGLTSSAVDAAWPEWWSEAAEASASAQAELRFSIARKLGLDARSLVDEGEPRFVWEDSARFKRFAGNAGRDLPILSSFGTCLGRILLMACREEGRGIGVTAASLRRHILSSSEFVGLPQLMGVAWALGIPVVHLRVYPLAAKKMSAMSVAVGERFAILLARDASYPASIAFYLAHEIGHIMLGHVREGTSIVDIDMMEASGGPQDPEEVAADEYALELLTGSPRPDIRVIGDGRSARRLATVAQAVGRRRGIEPGTLALAYGFTTQFWPTATRALEHIYDAPQEVWRIVNRIAMKQLDWTRLPEEMDSYVRAIMGMPHD